MVTFEFLVRILYKLNNAFLNTVNSSWLWMSHIQVLSCKVSNNPVSFYNFNFLIK